MLVNNRLKEECIILRKLVVIVKLKPTAVHRGLKIHLVNDCHYNKTFTCSISFQFS